MEFAENLILRLMEDPTDRDRQSRERIHGHIERARRFKANRIYPMRPYGFWTFERHNAQIFWDAHISQVRGRRNPYDQLLDDYTSSASSSSK